MMAVPAFAEGGQTFDLDASIVAPTIDVEVGSSDGKIVINPYQLKVDVENAAEDSSATTTDSILSKPVFFTNNSTCDVDVSVSVLGVGGDAKNGGVTFATAPFLGGTKAVTTKQVFLYMRSGLSADGSAEPTTWKESGTTKAYDAKTLGDVAISTKASAAKSVFVLAKTGTSVSDTVSPYGAIIVNGEANGASTVAWTSSDNVKVTFTYTLRPAVLPASGS